MRVLLVNTNRMKPVIAPLGLDYLADVLIAAGHDVQLLDLCWADDVKAAVTQGVRAGSPEVIGVTIRNTDDCYFSGQAFFLPEIREIIHLLRRESDAPVLLGGVGFSVAPVAALEFCGADYAMAGEGEVGLLEFLKALRDGSDLAPVPNLIRRVGKTLVRHPVRTVDLAALPTRRRALVDNARYFRLGGQAGFETKRGCPMPCVYCADPVSKGRTTRLLPPARVVAELSALRAQGIDHLHTCDCEFNLPRHHALAVAQAIVDAGLGGQIRWYAYCAPVPFDDELAAWFQRAGCAGINFGADSGHDEMLRRLGRPFTAEDLAQTAALCRRHRIPFMFDLLLGSPGETRETVRHSIEFVRRLAPDCVGLSLGVRLYEGTSLAQRLAAEGDLAAHPHLYGAKQDRPPFLKPVFYLAPGLGRELPDYVRELVAGDRRFFLPADSATNSNYNYSENAGLVDAIAAGARGAYWDILRQSRPA